MDAGAAAKILEQVGDPSQAAAMLVGHRTIGRPDWLRDVTKRHSALVIYIFNDTGVHYVH